MHEKEKSTSNLHDVAFVNCGIISENLLETNNPTLVDFPHINVHKSAEDLYAKLNKFYNNSVEDKEYYLTYLFNSGNIVGIDFIPIEDLDKLNITTDELVDKLIFNIDSSSSEYSFFSSKMKGTFDLLSTSKIDPLTIGLQSVYLKTFFMSPLLKFKNLIVE